MKKTIVLLLALTLMFSICAVPALAYSTQTEAVAEENAAAPITSISFYGNSGTYYYVNFSTNIVGYNHITTGDIVKVCQAMCAVIGYSPGNIDGIFGQNTETAIRNAQTAVGVTRDGVCGTNTWNAFYSYIGGITPLLKSYL